MNQPQAKWIDEALKLEFESREEILPYVEKAAAESGFFLTLQEELKLFLKVPVHFCGPEDFCFSMKGQILQIVEMAPHSFGTAVQLEDWSEKTARQLKEELTQPKEEVDTRPPILKIKDLNVTEKMRLAMKAGRVERELLMRDHSPQVMMALLANPRLEDNQILTIAKSRYASAGILKRIHDNRKWMSNYQIQLAVVRNPKTPIPLVIGLLPGLRKPDLSALAKGAAGREPIKNAALRLYLKRQ